MEIYNSNCANDIILKEPIVLSSLNSNGKHRITLIKNLPYNLEGLKQELKTLKKMFNCNGSIILVENYIILQGSHLEKLKKYYIERGFEVSSFFN